MALRYDFDIFDVIPDQTDGDAGLRAFLAEAGLESSRDLRQIALFRDSATAEALSMAPAALRDYFLESGFGLNTFDSGAPAGRYPPKDEAARLAIIERLTANAGRFLLPAPDDDAGAFSLAAFLDALSRARPVEEAVTQVVAVDAVSAPVSKSSALIAGLLAQVPTNVIGTVTTRLLRGVPFLGQIRRPG